MTTNNISINNNQVAVNFEGQTIQFVVWDLDASQYDDVKNQLVLAFNTCSNFGEIENHMQINGYDCSLEDIY